MTADQDSEIQSMKADLSRCKADNERLRRFIEIEKRIGFERDIGRLLPLIMAEISDFLDAERSSLFVMDWDCMELTSKFAQNLEINDIRIQLKMGIVGMSVLKGRIISVANAYNDPRFNSEVDAVTGVRTESLLAAPLVDDKAITYGAIELLNKRRGIFTREDEGRVRQYLEKLHATGFTLKPIPEFAKKILNELREAVDCDLGTVFLIDHGQGKLYSVASEGLHHHDVKLSLNLGVAGLCAITGQVLNIPDAYKDQRFDSAVDRRTGYKTRCLLSVPILNQTGEILGVIEAINKKNGVFNRFDVDHLEALSSGIAISLENAILFNEQEKQFKSILEVMAASIDAKDNLTAGHSIRMKDIAVGMARLMGFDETDVDVVRVAALLHDYGKLGVDDHVLKKEGRLEPDEYEHIKQHVSYTYEILKKMYFSRKYRNVPLIAACHHERLDGSGYLEGRAGQAIPFMSKIIAVADVYEALTAKRHYREAMASNKAVAIIEEGIGTSFDPAVVGALKQYLKISGS